MRVVVMLLVLGFAVGTARADAPDIGVLVVADGPLQKQVQDHVAAWIERAGWAYVKSPLSQKGTTTFENCWVLEDLTCASGVFSAQSRSASLIYISVDADQTFTVYWFAKRHDPLGDKLPCKNCSATTWGTMLDNELDKLAHEHRTLPVSKRPKKPSKLVPYLLIGTGIAALAGGGVFLYYGHIGGSDEKFIYPASTPIGITLAVAGGGAVLGGVLFLKSSGSSGSGPVASVGPSHAYVGWVTHF